VKRAALLFSALALVLVACGGTRDSATGAPGASATSRPSAGASSSAAPPAASPSAPAASADPRACPITAVSAPAPAGATKDLAVKPVIAKNSAPPPTQVTVADIVLGTGDLATTLSGVEVKYAGALYDTGVEFDSSWQQSPDKTFPFTVCATGTVPGFAVAPTGMKVGGRRQVTIPAEYGYGAAGSPPTIPGGATLVFVIDLVKVTPPRG